jgi:catechol 2,3-dioxygenase-like lactoylglutathione lyase family enzyme
MDAVGQPDCPFDRRQESLGNVVELQHVNIAVPDQGMATDFYITGLGLTRDPYIMTGTNNMWANAGISQFHLPTGAPQLLRGTVALVVPDRAALLHRLGRVARRLAGTRFDFHETADAVEAVCPWGNRIRLHAPDAARFGRITLGMPYVELDVPAGSTPGIAAFYRDILGTPAEAGAGIARVLVAASQHLVFRETDAPQPGYDGHHIQITLADFAAPHARLRERGLVSEESNPWQYRFLDIVDPASNAKLFRIEHEVRSMTHPLYARPLLNRNPDVTNQNYMPGHEAWPPAMPPE